jgi:hypothetical protein
MSTTKMLNEANEMRASLPATTRRGEFYRPGKVDGRLLDVSQLARLFDLRRGGLDAAEHLEKQLLERLATVGDGVAYQPDDLSEDEERWFMDAAKAAGAPTRDLDDKVYELEDALKVALSVD